MSYDDLLQKKVDSYNASVGDHEGVDCHACKNKGFIAVIKKSIEYMRVCECMSSRAVDKKAESSGISSHLKKCTFESFKVENGWQLHAKNTAKNFVKLYPHSKWLYMGGQVGAGKTHLCVAVVNKLMKMTKTSRYMLWRDDSTQLKALANNADLYLTNIEPLKKAEILYIDDLFKSEEGATPTEADIKLAHEILNYRYINRHLVTIISSELFIDDLIDIDQAIGSRVYEMSKPDFKVQIGFSREKNYRLRAV